MDNTIQYNKEVINNINNFCKNYDVVITNEIKHNCLYIIDIVPIKETACKISFTFPLQETQNPDIFIGERIFCEDGVSSNNNLNFILEILKSISKGKVNEVLFYNKKNDIVRSYGYIYLYGEIKGFFRRNIFFITKKNIYLDYCPW